MEGKNIYRNREVFICSREVFFTIPWEWGDSDCCPLWPKQTFNLVSFGTCVTKWGHVGWPGTATQPGDEAARPQGGQWHLQTCSWVGCRCHINVFSVLTPLQFKGFTLRGPPGQGRPSFPWPGVCMGRAVHKVSSEGTAKAWEVSATSCEKGNSHQT